MARSVPRVADDALLLEPAPLNAEQRNAVRDALTEPLTVITGPPGTGKSQVVSAILVNAAWRGQRVLFSSKNNKAVDVVLDRVNGLAPRPTVLRLGARALQEQLAQHLSAILSSRPTADDRRAYEQTLAQLKQRGEAFNAKLRAYEDLVALRNRVDGLERAAEEAPHGSEWRAILERGGGTRVGPAASCAGSGGSDPPGEARGGTADRPSALANAQRRFAARRQLRRRWRSARRSPVSTAGRGGTEEPERSVRWPRHF